MMYMYMLFDFRIVYSGIFLVFIVVMIFINLFFFGNFVFLVGIFVLLLFSWLIFYYKIRVCECVSGLIGLMLNQIVFLMDIDIKDILRKYVFLFEKYKLIMKYEKKN